MQDLSLENIFTKEVMNRLFPADRADRCFEVLFVDVSEGAYAIERVYKGLQPGRIIFEFHLKQRPGCCLVCSLTYGLPQVFSRHPVINVKGLVEEITGLLEGRMGLCRKWELDRTREVSTALHIIPLILHMEE